MKKTLFHYTSLPALLLVYPCHTAISWYSVHSTAPTMDSKMSNNIFYNKQVDSSITVWDDTPGSAIENKIISPKAVPAVSLRLESKMLDFAKIENDENCAFAKAQIVQASKENAYSGTIMYQSMAFLQMEGINNDPVMNVLKVTSTENYRYNLPLFFQGQLLTSNQNIKKESQLESIRKNNGYGSSWDALSS